jgi:internalin A
MTLAAGSESVMLCDVAHRFLHVERVAMSRPLLCGVVAWVLAAAPVRADDSEDKAVAFVAEMGGKVARDEKAPGKPVVAVDLEGTPVTDAGLKKLATLKNLSTPSLLRTHVTDAGLKELATLINLTALRLDGTAVTGAGLKELAALKNLSTLKLHGTEVTDTDLKELATLKNLTTLRLRGTGVTDVGLKELQKALPKCKIEK